MSSALGFRHEALFYRGVDDLLATTVPFLRDGAAQGDAMLVVLPQEKNALLRDALEDDASAVTFADMDEVGRNPARIIPAWRWFVDAHADGGRALRGIGEPIGPDCAGAVLDELHRHESLLNVAFADASAFQLVCPYDLDALDPSVAEQATRTHPLVHGGAASLHYEPVDDLVPFDTPFAEPPSVLASLDFDAVRLSAVRRIVHDIADQHGLDEDRIADLVLAVNEVATNSVEHGGGSGRLRLWYEAGTMVCEIRDRGLIDEPLLGRRFPSSDEERGRGHWIANQVCDLVQVHSVPTGTAVRLHVARSR